MTDTNTAVVDGRFNPNQTLGNPVIQSADVLQVIRPQLRFAKLLHDALLDAARQGRIAANPDLELVDGGDIDVHDALFYQLRENALDNVKDWAGDMGLVYSKPKLEEFIRQALIAAPDMEWGGPLD